jgi:hypothetical protein
LNYVFNKKHLISVANFIKRVAKSPTARVFFTIHLILLIVALVEKRSIYLGHLEYEPPLLYFLIIINLPWTIVASIISLPFFLIISFILDPLLALFIAPQVYSGDPYEPSLMSLYFYALWQIQWALIGYWIEKLFKSWRK